MHPSPGQLQANRKGVQGLLLYPPSPHLHPALLLPTPPTRPRLVHSEELQRACPIPFDEGRLWKGEHSEGLRAELQVGRC